VRELLHGPHRFGELADALPGISALVTRTAFPEIPPRVVYELTPVGQSLRSVLDAMNEWGSSVPPSVFDAAPAQG
jgi:DNA-binding HxlR family transcriptional regulator